jgi:hypothetical protein
VVSAIFLLVSKSSQLNVYSILLLYDILSKKLISTHLIQVISSIYGEFFEPKLKIDDFISHILVFLKQQIKQKLFVDRFGQIFQKF